MHFLDFIAGFGVSAVVGLLLGIVAITIIGPNTTGGAGLIILIGIAIAIVIGAVYRSFRPAKAPPEKRL
ncbi:hypothetical protein EH240_28920 [Mesorhizobium tamadayense]|uniref:Uncharacterized protein n=1 Tax=Mesorhizobium tamadayense TaxID=425306 RepID=A0A3P3F5E9_9HYPH|nr:hypothetical protein [Mesorhizobium tamadayense]RRH93627.1 hypothetical protein EH240_28920 [Mesorhizobium tamadayense]